MLNAFSDPLCSKSCWYNRRDLLVTYYSLLSGNVANILQLHNIITFFIIKVLIWWQKSHLPPILRLKSHYIYIRYVCVTLLMITSTIYKRMSLTLIISYYFVDGLLYKNMESM